MNHFNECLGVKNIKRDNIVKQEVVKGKLKVEVEFSSLVLD